MSATPTWAARVEAYLAYRRSLGFELSIEGGQLGSSAVQRAALFRDVASRSKAASSYRSPALQTSAELNG